MANRTIKLYGKVYGNSPSIMTVNWGGQEVFSGSVPTNDLPLDPRVSWLDLDQLATWIIDTSESGSTRLAITITNNPMVFHVLHANYFGDVTSGNVITKSSVDNWNDITGSSTEESTGYNNVTVDGIPITHAPTFGKNNWVMNANSTLLCDINVQPSIL